jgi:hypothetical protein
MGLWREGGDRPAGFLAAGGGYKGEGPAFHTEWRGLRPSKHGRMNLSLFDDKPRRRPGRPPAAEDREQRLKHIRCAALILSGQYPPKGVAALFGVSERTAYYWRDRALTYDDPEAEGLRRLTTGR